MRMLRLTSLAVGCVLFTLAFFASSPDLAAVNCKCLGGGITSTFTGAGTDCNSAFNSLYNQCAAQAESRCSGDDGTCLGTVTITNPCHFHQLDNMWKENGYMSYKCEICF
jgi:hypothetical protein